MSAIEHAWSLGLSHWNLSIYNVMAKYVNGKFVGGVLNDWDQSRFPNPRRDAITMHRSVSAVLVLRHFHSGI